VSRVVVVIPNWNGARFLDECLQSLMGQSQPCEIVVVDGASTDGSRDLIRGRFPAVTLLTLNANRGFAAAVNHGIEYALRRGAQYVALLNNDAVADTDWLANLIATADLYPAAGIVTSKLLRYDRKHLDSTGDFYSSWGWAYPRGRDELDDGQYDTAEFQEVFCGSGGASVYRASMLRGVGLFDEDYFAYLEDQDIGFRAQLMGWTARYESTAVAYHHMMGTSGTINNFGRYQAIRNCIYLYVKNMPGSLLWRYLPKYLLGLALMGANDIRRRRFRWVAGAYVEAVHNLPSMLVKRRQVQASRNVPVQYIDSILVHSLPPTQKRLIQIRNAFRRPRDTPRPAQI
jgi:GT2 family glycosyltransferase